MHIHGVQSFSSYNQPLTKQANNDGSSFGNLFLSAASDSGSGVEDFLNYAKETPAQRMFDNWLSGQHITMSQYNAMTDAEKQKLLEQYRQQLEQEMKGGANGSVGTPGTATAPVS
jgi:hypothetical protein